MSGQGVRGLRDLIPQSDPAGKASQFYSQAQGQKYIPQGNSGEKTASGAVMSGMGGAMAGAELGTLISASAVAGPWGAAIGGSLALGSYLFG